MEFREIYRFDELKNTAEEVVIDELERQLDEAGMRESYEEELILDMAAFALNLVPPMYRANLLGRVYAPAFEAEHRDEIRKAVAKAIKKIADQDKD